MSLLQMMQRCFASIEIGMKSTSADTLAPIPPRSRRLEIDALAALAADLRAVLTEHEARR